MHNIDCQIMGIFRHEAAGMPGRSFPKQKALTIRVVATISIIALQGGFGFHPNYAGGCFGIIRVLMWKIPGVLLSSLE